MWRGSCSLSKCFLPAPLARIAVRENQREGPGAPVVRRLSQGGIDRLGLAGAQVELDAVPDTTRTPKESGAIARRYLEASGRWNDAS